MIEHISVPCSLQLTGTHVLNTPGHVYTYLHKPEASVQNKPFKISYFFKIKGIMY